MEPIICWNNTHGSQISRDMKILVLKKWLYLPMDSSSCMTNKYLDLLSLETSNIYRLELDRYNQKLILDSTLNQKKKCSLPIKVIVGKLEGYFRQKGINLFNFSGNGVPDKRNNFLLIRISKILNKILSKILILMFFISISLGFNFFSVCLFFL